MPNTNPKTLQHYARKIADQQTKVTIDGKAVEMSVRDYFRKQKELNYDTILIAMQAFIDEPRNKKHRAQIRTELQQVSFGENQALSLEFLRAVETECNKSAMQRVFQDNPFGLSAGFVAFATLIALYTTTALVVFVPGVVTAIAALFAITNPIGAAFLVGGLILAALTVLTVSVVLAAHKANQTNVNTDPAIQDMTDDATMIAANEVQTELEVRAHEVQEELEAKAHEAQVKLEVRAHEVQEELEAKAHEAQVKLEVQKQADVILAGNAFRTDEVQNGYVEAFGHMTAIQPIRDPAEEALFKSAPVVHKVYNPMPTAALYTEDERSTANKPLKQLEIERNRVLCAKPTDRITAELNHVDVLADAVLRQYAEQSQRAHNADSAKKDAKAVLKVDTISAVPPYAKNCYCFLPSPHSDAGSATPVRSDSEYSDVDLMSQL
jgi:hypothetical protein